MKSFASPAPRSTSGTPAASPATGGMPRSRRSRLSAPALGPRSRPMPYIPPRPEAALGFYKDKPVLLSERPPFKVSKAVTTPLARARNPSPYKSVVGGATLTPTPKSPFVVSSPAGASKQARKPVARPRISGIPRYTKPIGKVTLKEASTQSAVAIAEPAAQPVVDLTADLPSEVEANTDIITPKACVEEGEEEEVVVEQHKWEHPLIKELKAKLEERVNSGVPRILIPRSTNVVTPLTPPNWPKLKAATPIVRKSRGGNENKENDVREEKATPSAFTLLVDSPFGTRRIRAQAPGASSLTPAACMDARVKMELEMLRARRAGGRV